MGDEGANESLPFVPPLGPQKEVATLSGRIYKTTSRRNLMAFSLIFPAVAFLFLIQVYPIAYAFLMSLHKIRGRNSTFIGLTNYINLFSDSDFWESLILTLKFTAGFLILTIAGGLGLALLLNRKLKMSALYLVLLFIPWILSPVVAGTMWRWLFQPAYGLVQDWLNPLVGHTLISDKNGSLSIVILSFLWQNLPLTTLLFLGGLQTISKEIYECSTLDGAGRWKTFLLITLPLIKPILLINMIMNTIRGLNVISIVMSITRGGPGRATNVLGLYLYQISWQFGDFGSGAALGFLMFIISLVLSYLYLKAVKTESL